MEKEEKILKVPSFEQCAKHKKYLLDMSEISILLDTYNDIFSDFDPRDLSIRALSDDFLLEAKKAVREKGPGIHELKFMIPENKRDLKIERIIKKRLKNHFEEHFRAKEKEVRDKRKNGLILASLGFLLMILGAIVLFTHFLEGSFISAVLIVVLEPAGWFFFWEGMAKALFLYEEHTEYKRDLEFYKIMSRCKIDFFAY
ncbi:MAG: hypothetical protein QXP53_00750 [Candidatus Pacearchaeota archaeon]